MMELVFIQLLIRLVYIGCTLGPNTCACTTVDYT